jgi:hypothetical protein
MRRCRLAREERVREVQRAEVQLHRARLADEARPEHLEDPFDLDERQPEPTDCSRVVGGVHAVVGERDRTGDLDGHRPDLRGHLQLVQRLHDGVVELGTPARHA